MGDFTNSEKADMHLIYGAANRNGRVAPRLYQERFPNSRMTNHKMFERLHRHLCENGSFIASCDGRTGTRTVRHPNMEETILNIVDETPRTSTRAIARRVHVSQPTVWRVLNEERLHPFHIQRVQALQASDYPLRVEFCQWFLQQCALQPDFPAYVLFTDEATFTQEGVFNVHNTHVWATENPHATRPHAFQKRFSVNVWAGIVNDFLIGPYLLPTRLHGSHYRIFLEEVLPELLQDVPTVVRNQMWFQHDGAPAHFKVVVRNYLDASFAGRWIGRGGPVRWPPRSPDLSSIDYFLWGHLKAIIYETPVDSIEDLVARLSIAAASVREMPGIFGTVRQSLLRRYQACITVGGRNFEHLL